VRRRRGGGGSSGEEQEAAAGRGKNASGRRGKCEREEGKVPTR
jgi:hypothetical protein